MSDSLEELAKKISDSLNESGRWKFVHDEDHRTGPWRNRLDDSESEFSIGCVIHDSTNPGYYYLSVAQDSDHRNEYSSDSRPQFSLSQREVIWKSAMPVYESLRSIWQKEQDELLNKTFS